jgi:hypothetical protein
MVTSFFTDEVSMAIEAVLMHVKFIKIKSIEGVLKK